MNRKDSLMCRILLAGGVVFASLPAGEPSAVAQFPASNVTLEGRKTLAQLGSPSGGNDCWGYVSASGREYALMGVRNGMSVVEITNPSNPIIVDKITHSGSLWGDIKVYQDHAYVSNESGGGIDIVDLSDVDNGNVTLVQRFTAGGLSTSHNVAIDTDSGFLYLCIGNINGGRLVAYDLSNPGNPVLAGMMTATAGGSPLHDAQIVTYTSGVYAGRQICFGASEGRGLDVIDVTDKNNMFRMSRSLYSGLAYCHQCWATPDLQYLFVDDEADEGNMPNPQTRTIVFDIRNLNNPNVVRIFSTGLPTIDHNLYVRGNYLFEANYTSGLRIFDVSDPVNPAPVGFFDTFPSSNSLSFNGAWSVYPFFPSGTIIVSDTSGGLFVLSSPVTQPRLVFNAPNGLPRWVSTDGGTAVRIEVEGRELTPQPGTGMLHVSTGGPFIGIPMVEVSPNVYDAVFPGETCLDTINYYFSAQDSNGATFTGPFDAPASTHVTLSARGLNNVFADGFETDKGWTVQNTLLLDGEWERGVPANGGIRGDPPSDFDGSGRCFITGNGVNADVDGGPTSLLSPLIDLSSTIDPELTYARWFTNTPADDDTLEVAISDDGGASWTVIETVQHHVGWVERTMRVTDHASLTDQVRLRFSAVDNPNSSITEAAIDAVVIRDFTCTAVLCIKGDTNEDQNVNGIDISLFVRTLVNGAAPGTAVFCATDMDGDGVLDVSLDGSMFVTCLLGGFCP